MIPALVNHLWQSTVFCLVIAVLAAFMRGGAARLRFWLWFAASAKFLFPFALLSGVGRILLPAHRPSFGSVSQLVDRVAEPFAGLSPGGPVVKATDLAPLFDPTPSLLALWGVGIVVIVAGWSFQGFKVRSILRSSHPLPWVGSFPIRASAAVGEPWLVGVRRPAVILPSAMVRDFPPEEIDAILAHEASHLENADNLWAGLHMLVAALFWFHPFVWWIGHRMVEERERACDDAVVLAGHPREVYARAILETCRHYIRSPLACVSGALGANLTQRIEAIMLSPPPRPATASQKGVMFVAGLAAIAAPLFAGLAAGPFILPPTLAAWLYAGPSREQIAHDLAEQTRPRAPIPFEPGQFDRFVGQYDSTPHGLMTLFRRGDRFFTQMTSQTVGEIYPGAGGEFFYKSVPAQISFEIGPGGEVSALVLHQNGWKSRFPKLDALRASALRADLAARIAANRPSPGTEAFIRRWLAASTTNYQDMVGVLARDSRQQLPEARDELRSLGPRRGVRFVRVSAQGADLYVADFAKGQLFIRIAPLVDGKATSLFARRLSPKERM